MTLTQSIQNETGGPSLAQPSPAITLIASTVEPKDVERQELASETGIVSQYFHVHVLIKPGVSTAQVWKARLEKWWPRVMARPNDNEGTNLALRIQKRTSLASD
jgi:hypothetical protein